MRDHAPPNGPASAELMLRNGVVLAPGGPAVADVRIAGGIIVAVGPDLDRGAGEEIDCRGSWIGPGFVDVHTHLREPGLEWKEDIASGSAAAAAGGYTAVVAMPNTDPATDNGDRARYIAERGRQIGLVDVLPAGCLTQGRAGERLVDFDELWDAGVRLFTDDGDTLADAGLVRRAMVDIARLGGVLSEHAIDPGLGAGGQMHEGTVSAQLGIRGVPSIAEEVVIARDLMICRLTGARYHVQHLSTRGAVELVRAAKSEGLPVTAEATPHHLMFDHDAVDGTDTSFKMMPPLREPEDVAAVRAGLVDGTIDVVATDHAPHSGEEKAVPFEQAPFGVTGIEWSAAVANLVIGDDPVRFFDRMSVGPAGIMGLADHGRWIAPGNEANIVVFDPNATFVVSTTRSKSRNAPYFGRELRGVVRRTIFRGNVTWAYGSDQTGVRT